MCILNIFCTFVRKSNKYQYQTMKTYIAMISAALLPAILLLLFIWKKDPKKEPFKQLLKAFLYGVGICIPVVFVELGVNWLIFGDAVPATLLAVTTEAFVEAALVEETFKLIALWLVLRKNPYFDEHFDGIVYAVCVGLGFAAIENVLYVVGSEDWGIVAIMHALLAVPGHYAFAVLMGYYYALYHFVDRSVKNAIAVLLVPVMAHGIYDLLCMSGGIAPELGVLVFIGLIYFCIKMHRVAYAHLNTLIEKDREIDGLTE